MDTIMMNEQRTASGQGGRGLSAPKAAAGQVDRWEGSKPFLQPTDEDAGL